MFEKQDQYSAVPQDEDCEAGERLSIASPTNRRGITWRWLSLCVPWALALGLLVSNIYTWSGQNSDEPKDVVFSPATSAVRYRNVVGTSGVLNENSPYQGDRTEENDQLWEDLYNFGISRIPLSEAAQLINRTMPIAKDPGYYAVILDVFHQLHCLNMIRKRVWSRESFDEMQDGPLNTVHMDHCLDSLRQSLMCSGDITPMPFVWYKQFEEALPATGIMRTCRDFEALRDWAKERQSYVFDTLTFTKDPLGNVYHD